MIGILSASRVPNRERSHGKHRRRNRTLRQSNLYFLSIKTCPRYVVAASRAASLGNAAMIRQAISIMENEHEIIESNTDHFYADSRLRRDSTRRRKM
jgi:hypothetical protein